VGECVYAHIYTKIFVLCVFCTHVHHGHHGICIMCSSVFTPWYMYYVLVHAPWYMCYVRVCARLYTMVYVLCTPWYMYYVLVCLQTCAATCKDICVLTYVPEQKTMHTHTHTRTCTRKNAIKRAQTERE